MLLFMRFKRAAIFLWVILLLGAGVRAYRVGEEGIWLDEGVSIARAGSPVSRIVSGRDPDPSPPLYYLLLHFWIKVFGDSELSIRIPSVIFGVLAVFAIYRAGGVFFDRRTGLTAALFLALAAFPVYFSREARMYPLLLLLSLVSYYFLGKMLRGGGPVAAAGYICATAGALYTHNLGISTVLAQNIFILCVLRKKDIPIRRWYTLQGLLLILYLPALATLLRQLTVIGKSFWSPPPSALDPVRTIVSYAGSLPAAAGLVALAAFAFFPRQPIEEGADRGASARGNVLLVSWLLTPILLPFLASLISTPIYISRITIAAAPALYLLAARGAVRIPGKGRRAVLTGLTGLLLVLPLREFYRPLRTEPWREVVRMVEAEAKPGDGVLVSPPWYQRFCFEYYRTRDDITVRGISDEVFYPGGVPRLIAAAEGYPRTWIVYFQERDLTPLLEENFSGRFQPEASRVKEYHNFQAGRRMGIRVYLLSGGRD